MAKFSQALLGSLTQSPLQQGMFDLGQTIGAAPAVYAEQKKKAEEEARQAEAMSLIQKAYQTQDASMFADAATVFQKSNPEFAMKLLGLSQEVRAASAEKQNTENLRQDIIDRASRIPGLEGLASTAANANTAQLESMRATVLKAEQDKQSSVDNANKAVDVARAANISEEVIGGYKNDPEGLLALSNAVTLKRETTKLDALDEKRQLQIQVARAKEAQLPPSLIQDVEAGLYVGQNNNFSDLLSGKAFSSSNYQVQEGSQIQGQPPGSLINLPTLGGKVNYNGKMYYPNELGLVEGPKVTAEGSVTGLKSETKMLPFAANAAGVVRSFVNNLDDIADLNTKIAVAAGESITPFNTDISRNLRALQQTAPEVLVRISSGAAIKNDELPRYEKMFSVSVADLTAPLSAAEKTIRTAALVSISSRIMSGSVSPEEGRALLEQAGSITLSEEDADKIRKGGKGSLKSVVKKYTDVFLNESGSSSEPAGSTVDSIRNKYNF